MREPRERELDQVERRDRRWRRGQDVRDGAAQLVRRRAERDHLGARWAGSVTRQLDGGDVTKAQRVAVDPHRGAGGRGGCGGIVVYLEAEVEVRVRRELQAWAHKG